MVLLYYHSRRLCLGGEPNQAVALLVVHLLATKSPRLLSSVAVLFRELTFPLCTHLARGEAWARAWATSHHKRLGLRVLQTCENGIAPRAS